MNLGGRKIKKVGKKNYQPFMKEKELMKDGGEK